MNNELFDNWKQFIESEIEGVNFEYSIINSNELIFKLVPSKKNNNCENILKILFFLLSINDNKESNIDNIIYKKINMKNLLPKNIHKDMNFYYHLSLRFNTKFEIDNNKKEKYLSKISYKKLLIHNKNDEEILFGYKITPQFKELFEFKNKNNNIDNETDILKNISVGFSNDLELLLQDKNLEKEFKKYIKKLDFSMLNQKVDKYRTIKYKFNKKPDSNNEEFIKYFESLINIAKDVKKENLLNEEIGLGWFYKLLFEKEKINIFGTNLKNKIYFAIRNLLVDNEKEIKIILNKINFYDIAYICKEKSIDFYMKYMNFKKEENMKNLTMTQKFGYIIQENEFLRNIENLKEYRNIFYADEKEKIESKLYIDIDKKKFYKKGSQIIDILKDKTDFTININNDNNNQFRINFIEPEKFKLINSISKEINNI